MSESGACKMNAERKIVLVTQKTRLEELIHRHNTFGQAKFYIEHHGGDFSDYQQEHQVYQEAVDTVLERLRSYGRLQRLDRDHVSNYIFGQQDLVIALGRDGLVVNVMKYLDGQALLGVNPDPARWDGVLLPFSPKDLQKVLPEALGEHRPVQRITLAQATLNDGQIIYGVNDIFIGQRTHTSARYELAQGGCREMQSSSGIIVSTGLGATGWFKSILAGATGIARFCGQNNPLSLPEKFDKSAQKLYYTVREPYPSTSTGAELVFGKIDANTPLRIVSCMPDNGVIFSDGMEADRLEFNSGAVATIGIADRKGHLVI